MDASEQRLAQADRAARVEALVQQLSETEHALQDLLDCEVGAVVDPVRGTPIILRQAQAELRRSEACTRLLLEQVPAIVWTTDGDLCLISIAGKGADVLGKPAGDLIGCSLVDVVEEHAGLAGALAAHYRALEGQQASYDATLGERVFHGTVEPLHGEAGQIVGCVGLGLDITPEEIRQQNADIDRASEELVAVHNDLEASRLRYRDLFESAPDGYLVTDPVGVVRRANRAAVDLLGMHEEMLRDSDLVTYVAGGDRAEFHRRMDRVRAGEDPGGVEWQVHVRSRANADIDRASVDIDRASVDIDRASDGIFPAALTVSPIRDREGVLTGLRWLLRDISPSKRAEERERLLEEVRVALEETQAANRLLRTLLDTMPVGVVVCNAEGALLMTNPPGQDILGERVVGTVADPQRSYTPHYPDGSPFPSSEMPLARAMALGEMVDGVEILIRREDGSERTILAGAAPVRDNAGQIVSGVTVFQDISARKEMERERAQVRQALRRYADRLQGLYEADQAILAARSVDEIARVALRRVPDLLDCVRADVILYDLDAGEMALLAVHTAGETRVGRGWRSTIDEAWTDVLETLAQGAPHIIEDVQQSPSDSPWRMALKADIDRASVEHVRALVAVPLIVEGALIGSLNLGMRTPEQLTSGQMDVAGELAIQLALGIHQARLREQVQRHADELEKQVRRRTAALHASQARLRAIFDNATVGIALTDLKGHVIESNPGLQKMLGYTAEELKGKHFVEFTHPEDAEADEALFQELLVGKRESYRLLKRYIRKDGDQLWSNLHVSFVHAPRGKPRFAVALVEDVTEQRAAQQALMRSEKLALTGRLAASLAHEINNPLQSVVGCLDLAEESLAEGQQADVRQMLQIGAEELQRAATIVTQLRDLNRPSELGNRELVDVKDLLEQVLLLTKKQCRQHHVEVIWEPGHDLPWLSVVPDEIKQVFLNLVLNAVEAMPDGGQLRIGIRQTSIRALHTDEPEGVRITFHDTGVGISPEALSELFDPFYTTKEEGLGLGLYVSYNIVDAHDGRIDVESRVGEGTTFTLWLPVDGG